MPAKLLRNLTENGHRRAGALPALGACTLRSESPKPRALEVLEIPNSKAQEKRSPRSIPGLEALTAAPRSKLMLTSCRTMA